MKKFKRLSFLLFIIIFTITAASCSLTPSGEGDPNDNLNKAIYDIENEHFSLICATRESIGEKEAVRVAFSTDISIFSHTANIKLFNEGGEMTAEKTILESFNYNGGDTISHYIEIENNSDFSRAEISVSGKSYENPYEIAKSPLPRVTFYACERIWATAAASAGEAIQAPDIPTFYGCYFAGWYADTDYTTPFDFSATYTKNTSAYARIIPSADEITNKITTELIPSVVTIRTTYYRYQGFQKISTSATSSGFVISCEGDTLIMTNCHAVELQPGYTSMTIVVEDCLGNQYSAEVLTTNGVRAISAEYDLALLKVSKMTDTTPLTLAEKNPKAGEAIISVGSPAGQKNAITFGTITSYTPISIDIDESLSNVSFPIISHTSLIAGGSSGGALLNSSLEVVGVNFAGDEGDGFTNGYAIPIERVMEFLGTYLGN